MELNITTYCHIYENKVIVNDNLLFFQGNFITFADFIKAVYKQEQTNYPKFYKMDTVSKLGFLAADLALKSRSVAGYGSDAVGVIFSNSSSSLDTDIAHNETIRDRTNYFPSPSVFVYTLPNIVIGEICIRHKIKGENAFLISEAFDSLLLFNVVHEHFENSRMEACLCGWVELMGNKSHALVMLVEKAQIRNQDGAFIPVPFTSEKMNQLIERI
jgi:hypothetical protein